MKTKRILVTGASGFIGRPLVAALLRAGYAVRAATRRQVSFPNSVEVAIVPDFLNPVDWNPILQGVDIIVHLAGMVHSKVPDTAYSEFDQINWIATQRLAHAAKEVGIERFVCQRRSNFVGAGPNRRLRGAGNTRTGRASPDQPIWSLKTCRRTGSTGGGRAFYDL